ncbi:Ribosome biogenesis protein brx1 [Puttea exsequens]|nr:Ribosome biogenesis protein brx1 [Puttea exsequens]
MATVYKSLSHASPSTTNHPNSPPSTLPQPHRPHLKQRVLLLSSRGTTHRHRHLLNDIHALLPHSRKESKLDTKSALHTLNELADLYNCNNVLYFEARKGKDLYVWMAKAPNGPTVKMHLENLHTTSELHFPGNCLRGSRPFLSFSSAFNTSPHLQVIKELLTHIFGVPPGARRAKPFVDHVMGFTVADGRVWVRVWEIKERAATDREAATTTGTTNTTTTTSTTAAAAAASANKKSGKGGKGDIAHTALNLTELGPRFVLTPIVILEGSFGGPVIYENKLFVSPNQVRAEARLGANGKAGKFARRMEEGGQRRGRRADLLGDGRRGEGELEERVLFR